MRPAGPLGLFSDGTKLEPLAGAREVIVCYSDGVTEDCRSERRRSSDARLVELGEVAQRKTARGIVDAITAAITTHYAGAFERTT